MVVLKGSGFHVRNSLFVRNPPPDETKSDPSNDSSKNGNIKRFLTVALIGLAASLFWFFNSTTGSTIIPSSPVDQLLSEHYAKPHARDILKWPNTTLAVRGNAYIFYQNKEYSKSISSFEQLISNGEGEQEDFFYLGLSYLYTQQPNKAAKHLKTLIDGPPNNYQDIATWYLALALTDAEAYDEAKVYLSKVANWSGNKGKEESAKHAVELMRVIDEKQKE